MRNAIGELVLDKTAAAVLLQNRMVISVNVEGIVALPEEGAVSDGDLARAGGKMGSIGVGGDVISLGGHVTVTLHQHIFGVIAGDAHAGTAVNGDVLDSHVL